MPRRRALLATTVCAAFGAATTLIVAFACARWAPRQATAVPLARSARSLPTEGISLKPLRTGFTLYGMAEYGFGYEYVVVLAINRRSQTTTQFGSGRRCEAGWPGRAWVIVCDNPPIPNAPPDYRGWFWSSGSVFARPTGTITICRPLWTGFALNTAGYAAALWLMAFAPFAVRRFFRRRRRKRGRCERCGYPVAGLARCPECGLEAKMP